MVMTLILRGCLVLLFARRVWRLDLFLPARRIRDGLCAESATAGHGFLDSGIVLCVFAWKTLGRFELSGFAVSDGYERYRFLLANTQGKPAESQASDSSMLRGRGGRRRMTSIERKP